MEAALLPVFEEEPILLEVSELPTASVEVLQQVRQIIDGRFNSRAVSPTLMMIATGNPLTPDYTSVRAELCKSIEERLHPYIVVPEVPELFAIWSTMMDPIVYQFLLKHERFVPDLSPRCWVSIADTVEGLMEAGVDPANVLKDIRPQLVESIEAPLQLFLREGYKPDKVPILGREFLGASNERFIEYMERMKRWLDRSERGFVGATKIDIARVLLQSDPSFTQQFPEAPRRFTALMELLIGKGAQDIASSLLDVLYKSDTKAVAKPIMEVFKKSSALKEMGQKFREFVKKHEDKMAS
jgi:hypothetical protein